MRYLSCCLLPLLYSLSAGAASTSITLKPQDVTQLILKQSPLAKEVSLTAGQSLLTQAEAEKAFDWSLTATYGYQLSKFESVSNAALEENKTLSSSISLQKPFQTGTTLSLQYTSSTVLPKVSSGTGNDSSTDIAGIALKQNLWNNFFGVADRASLRSADATLKSADLLRQASLQDLILAGLQSYWKAYVAQETSAAAVKSRNRYQKLVESIQKKTRYGYANPAELAQAQAELESRDQKVRTEAANAALAKDQLITSLGLTPGMQVQFDIPDQADPPPEKASPLEVEKSRPIQAAQHSATAALETLSKVESQASPDLSLIAQYDVQGFDSSPGGASREMTDGTHPKYYVGLQLTHSFGSGYQAQNVETKRMAKDLAIAQLDRKKLELQDSEADIKRRLQSTFAIYQSSLNQKFLREKASQELTKTYTQGRTDISNLIDSLNKYFDSEAAVSKSFADYQMTLAQWQALQDQLLPVSAQ
jgi:outer membrane protein TolC